MTWKWTEGRKAAKKSLLSLVIFTSIEGAADCEREKEKKRERWSIVGHHLNIEQKRRC